MNLKELENTILDQIEKLNDDSLFEDKETANIMINKSKSIADLSEQYMGIQRYKLDVVKTLSNNGGQYENVLGIEANEKF